jgi:hypothetical protein
MLTQAWPFLAGLLLNPAADAPGGKTVTVSSHVQYRFVQDLDRSVAIVRANLIVFGQLDAAGNFIQDRKRPSHPLGAPFSGPGFSRLNQEAAGEPVYEFRSDHLIRGSFDESGNFVPDPGSIVLDFKDYRYRPDGIRIYNLPGRFVKVEEDLPQNRSGPTNRKDTRQPGKPR